MSIIFVSGPPCSGKSTFIKKNFPDHTVVDLWNYQYPHMSMAQIRQSYEECMNDLIAAIKRGENVVLEHTLLRAIRRKPYIEAVQEATNEDIKMYFFIPTKEDLRLRAMKRDIHFSDDEVDSYFEVMEIPTTDEGFSEIVICK